jgi:hypothetical protein
VSDVLSEEMKAALAILREDKIIANTAAARKANEDLIARLDARDAADTERWAKFEETSKRPPEPPTPENDPAPDPNVPPAPPPAPELQVKAKKRGLWFNQGEEEN